MKTINKILETLNEILKEQHPLRTQLVKSVQNIIWNDESIIQEDLNEILSELAYDLDFYEPNKNNIKENSSYYSNEKLESIVKSGISNLMKLLKNENK